MPAGFCLTTDDQLFCFPEKLSRCLPKIILYKSFIHVIVFSQMNRCSKSGIHAHSPDSQIHIQIFHRIARLSSRDFPDHGEDGFQKNGMCLAIFGGSGSPKFLAAYRFAALQKCFPIHHACHQKACRPIVAARHSQRTA